MAFSASDVQALREKTGCGMMDCKKALSASDGDMDKAVEFLREKGLAAAAKKSGRIASEGVVDVYTDGNITAMVEVNSETDFVAKNAAFKEFVKGIAKVAAAANPADLQGLMDAKYDGSKTVTDVLHEKILAIGENLVVRRFVRFSGTTAHYVHDDRIGVVTVFDTDVAEKPEFVTMGKDICMQIVAMNPEYVGREAVPAEVIDKEKEILLVQIRNDEKNKNKPQNILEKMVSGRIGKFYETNCLLDQAFVKDGNITVGQYVENTAKALGGKITVKEFVRYERGEGLTKREDNFAEEISKLVK
jgi:elongation factor Ts